MKETSSFRIYIKIYAKGDVFLRKKIGIILMIAMLVCIVIGSQTLGERLYSQVDKKGDSTGQEEKTKQSTDNVGIKENSKEIAEETTSEIKKKENKKEDNMKRADDALIVLDSGHGGVDPGKIGINGTLEKEVNLNIAKKVESYLKKQGYTVIMTRETDEGLADSKVEDLKTRVSLINDKKPLIAVSIHQNSYSQESIHGAQIFYYTHSKSGEKAAKILQEAMLDVDQDNTRQAKENDTYYLLKKTKIPTVIVECGFLSNQKEADLLITEEYQEKMAAAVAKGIHEYILSEE